MPWWEKRLYWEGFKEEGLIHDGDQPIQQPNPNQALANSPAGFQNMVNSVIGDFARGGIRERNI